jgi:signal peptidase II
MFPNGGVIFLIIPVVVSVIIVYYYRQLTTDAWLVRVALGLQMGGALGNLIDRIRQGYVVDFLHLEHWPVSNVSDICIVMGVVLLGIEMVREERQLAQQSMESGKPSEMS